MLCGCVGKNGGGLNHYVGQEKLAPIAPWSTLMGALDWSRPPRFQNTPSFHYVHSDQWRYERTADEARLNPDEGPEAAHRRPHHRPPGAGRAPGLAPLLPPVRPQPPGAGAPGAGGRGARREQEIIDWTRRPSCAEKKLRFAVEDPDAPENWPRVWFIWRGNALMSSAKGHEYFLKHYLGTHTNTVAPETARESVREAVWREQAPEGKLDLVVDLNFRMDTSALYSDIVLPAATWYEKDDLNTTDMHSFIHPLQAAVPPCWESKSDWDIFRAIAEKVSALAAQHLPGPLKDIVAVAAAARHPGRDGPARGARLEQGGVRAGPRQDDAGAGGGRARPRQPPPPIHLLRPGGPGEGARGPRPQLADRGYVRRAPRHPADGGVGGRALPLGRRRRRRRQPHPSPGARDQRRGGLPGLPGRGEEGRAARSPTWPRRAGTSAPPSRTSPSSPAGC